MTSCLTEAEVDERIRKVLDDKDPTLAWDWRVTSSGRPEQCMDFLTRCQDFVKSEMESAFDDCHHDALSKD